MKQLKRKFILVFFLVFTLILLFSSTLKIASLISHDIYFSKTNILFSIPVFVIIAINLVWFWPFGENDNE
jgi:membrane-bound acyltransferase YfiQ involved in biofilm formation